MDFWWRVLIAALIGLIVQQRQKCIDEGRPFFRVGRRLSNKQRTQSTSCRAASVQTASYQKQSRQRYSQKAEVTPSAYQRRKRPSVNEDALASKRIARQPSPDVMVRSDLVSQLNALTHNEATAKRLILSLKQRHPERSLDWCAERAINDIERDRR